MAGSRPLQDLAPPDVLQRLTTETHSELAAVGGGGPEFERLIRARLDEYHLDVFKRTQDETTKRWTYEQEVKRPYFHVTELDEGQLANWQKYLDFEEAEGDFGRICFLYERCLVTAAHYDKFWHRYARWMYAQEGKEEEVRNIFQRASCFYVPIARPAIRTQWALFEETCGRPSVAAAIYEAILVVMPDHLEAIVSLANLQRRQEGYASAIAVYQQYLENSACPTQIKGALVAEMARLAWKTTGNVEEGRDIFQRHQQWYLDSQPFFDGYLTYELDQPTSAENEMKQYLSVKAVHDVIRHKSHLPPDAVKELSQKYMKYLTERGGSATAKEYMELDAEVNGPASIVPVMRARNFAQKKPTPAQKANGPNGHHAAS